MTSISGKKDIASLNKQMFELVASSPDARGPLFDFHFKSEFENYLSAIQNASGRKLFVSATNTNQLRHTIRQLVLLADLIVFNAHSYTGSGKISLFPIPDKVRSPVLGLNTVLDPSTEKERSPTPREITYLLASLGSRSLETGTPEGILGIEWTPGTPGWKQSYFTRTSEPYQNKKGQKCHIATGLSHLKIPNDDRFLEDVKPLLTKGHVAFAPFIRTSEKSPFIDEAVLKAGLFNAALSVQDSKIQTKTGSLHPLTHLKIPYLENVSFPLLSKILEDEKDSIISFRKQLDRVIEDVSDSTNPDEAKRTIKKFKRELLEDELYKIQQTLERVSRMKALTSIGAFVGTITLSIGGILGLGIPELVIGGGEIARVSLRELYRNFESKKNIQSSPMHFVWRIKSKTG